MGVSWVSHSTLIYTSELILCSHISKYDSSYFHHYRFCSTEQSCLIRYVQIAWAYEKHRIWNSETEQETHLQFVFVWFPFRFRLFRLFRSRFGSSFRILDSLFPIFPFHTPVCSIDYPCFHLYRFCSRFKSYPIKFIATTNRLRRLKTVIFPLEAWALTGPLARAITQSLKGS